MQSSLTDLHQARADYETLLENFRTSKALFEEKEVTLKEQLAQTCGENEVLKRSMYELKCIVKVHRSAKRSFDNDVRQLEVASTLLEARERELKVKCNSLEETVATQSGIIADLKKVIADDTVPIVAFEKCVQEVDQLNAIIRDCMVNVDVYQDVMEQYNTLRDVVDNTMVRKERYAEVVAELGMLQQSLVDGYVPKKDFMHLEHRLHSTQYDKALVDESFYVLEDTRDSALAAAAESDARATALKARVEQTEWELVDARGNAESALSALNEARLELTTLDAERRTVLDRNFTLENAKAALLVQLGNAKGLLRRETDARIEFMNSREQEKIELISSRDRLLEELASVRAAHVAAIEQLRSEHANELETVGNKAAAEMERLRLAQLEEKANFNERNAAATTQHAGVVSRLEEKLSEQIESIYSDHSRQLSKLNDDHCAVIRSIESKHTEELKAVGEEKKRETKQHIKTVQLQHEQQINTLQTQHDTELRMLRESILDLMTQQAKAEDLAARERIRADDAIKELIRKTESSNDGIHWRKHAESAHAQLVTQSEVLEAANTEKIRLQKENQRLRDVARDLESNCTRLSRRLDEVKGAVVADALKDMHAVSGAGKGSPSPGPGPSITTDRSKDSSPGKDISLRSSLHETNVVRNDQIDVQSRDMLSQNSPPSTSTSTPSSAASTPLALATTPLPLSRVSDDPTSNSSSSSSSSMLQQRTIAAVTPSPVPSSSSSSNRITTTSCTSSNNWSKGKSTYPGKTSSNGYPQPSLSPHRSPPTNRTEAGGDADTNGFPEGKGNDTVIIETATSITVSAVSTPTSGTSNNHNPSASSFLEKKVCFEKGPGSSPQPHRMPSPPVPGTIT